MYFRFGPRAATILRDLLERELTGNSEAYSVADYSRLLDTFQELQDFKTAQDRAQAIAKCRDQLTSALTSR